MKMEDEDDMKLTSILTRTDTFSINITLDEDEKALISWVRPAQCSRLKEVKRILLTPTNNWGAGVVLSLPQCDETGVWSLKEVAKEDGEYVVDLNASIGDLSHSLRDGGTGDLSGWLVGRVARSEEGTNPGPKTYSALLEIKTTSFEYVTQGDSVLKVKTVKPEPATEPVRMNPIILTLPDSGYNEIGIQKVDRGSWWFEYQLYWFANGAPAAPVVLRAYEDSNIRFALLALGVTKWSRQTGYSGSWTGLEWGYSEAAHAWILMRPDGMPSWIRGAQNGFDEVTMVGTSPVVVYSRRRPTRDGFRVLHVTLQNVLKVVIE